MLILLITASATRLPSVFLSRGCISFHSPRSEFLMRVAPGTSSATCACTLRISAHASRPLRSLGWRKSASPTWRRPPPVRYHGLEELTVFIAAFYIGFSLIPYCTCYGKVDERVYHAVVKHGRLVTVEFHCRACRHGRTQMITPFAFKANLNSECRSGL